MIEKQWFRHMVSRYVPTDSNKKTILQQTCWLPKKNMNWTCNQAIEILKLAIGGSHRTCQRQGKMESFFEHAHMMHYSR